MLHQKLLGMQWSNLLEYLFFNLLRHTFQVLLAVFHDMEEAYSKHSHICKQLPKYIFDGNFPVQHSAERMQWKFPFSGAYFFEIALHVYVA